jgi:hypothetical protein
MGHDLLPGENSFTEQGGPFFDHRGLGASDLQLRMLRKDDKISPITALIRSSYRRLADMGLRYTANWQEDAITNERVARGECYLAFINRIENKSKLRLNEIAERIPMGYQHLSDLKNGRSFPSYHFWGLLYSIYRNPDLLDQFDPRTEEAPVSHYG